MSAPASQVTSEMTAKKDIRKAVLDVLPVDLSRCRSIRSWSASPNRDRPSTVARCNDTSARRKLKPEIIRRSSPQGKRTAHYHHNRNRQNAGHHRQCIAQEPSALGSPDVLAVTVTRFEVRQYRLRLPTVWCRPIWLMPPRAGQANLQQLLTQAALAVGAELAARLASKARDSTRT